MIINAFEILCQVLIEWTGKIIVITPKVLDTSKL